MKVKDIIDKLSRYNPDTEVTMLHLLSKEDIEAWEGTPEGQAWDEREFFEGTVHAKDIGKPERWSGGRPVAAIVMDGTVIRDGKRVPAGQVPRVSYEYEHFRDEEGNTVAIGATKRVDWT